jgi:hypothetical protein
MNRTTRWLAVPAAGLILVGLATTSAMASMTPAIHASRTVPAHPLRPLASGATTHSGITNSPYYAGYVDLPKKGGATSFKYVTASFTVPTLNCTTTPNSEVTQIVGLGGWTNDSQYRNAVGIYSECSGGTAYYEGVIWRYSYPSDGPYDVLAVSPGDSIVGSVYFSSASYEDTFKLVDQTASTYYETSQSAYDNSSAEVLTGGNLNSDGTADFGSVAFNTVKAIGSTGLATWLDGANFKTLHVIEKGPVTGLADAEPTPIVDTAKPAESAFTNTWYRQN